MLGLLISNAHAQAAGPQANPIMNFVPIILVFIVFYFLMIKPQKKKMQEEQKFVAELQKGSEVFTKSGMIGTISGLTEKVVTLEVEGGVKVKFLRSQIAGSTKSLYESADNKKK
jgi:preprotein translocase subunit YajC